MHMIIGAAKLFGEQNGSAGARDIGAKAGNDGHSRERKYRRSALGRRRKRSRLAVYPRLTSCLLQPPARTSSANRHGAVYFRGARECALLCAGRQHRCKPTATSCHNGRKMMIDFFWQRSLEP